jgi:hypothetical protein
MASNWGGWGRTSNLPVNSRALCQLSYTPKAGTHDWCEGVVTLPLPAPEGQGRHHLDRLDSEL